jgi:AcrR family transcriptional regulator
MVHKKEYKKKLKQLSIIEAAKVLFLEKRYNSITVDEIAKLAGLTKKTMYCYFPSKLALYIHIFEDHLQKLQMELSKCLEQDLPTDRLILAAFETFYKFSKKNEKFMLLFWQINSEDFNGDLPEELVNRINFWNKTLINDMLDVIRKAQNEELLIQYDPVLLVHLFSAMNKGIFVHTNKESKFHIANIQPDDLYNTFVTLIKRGVILRDRDSR